jgi:acyl-CoA synthetase (AMP-forming)/AMP-acid ligase II
MTVVARALLGAAERFGDRPAVVHDGGPAVTYAELAGRAGRFAAGLAAEGYEGAVVALDLPSDADWVAACAAVSWTGGVAAGINPRSTTPERAAVLDRLAPDLVLTADAVEALDRDAPAPTLPPPDPERLAAVVFTSGTTGEPKGATFRERHLDAIRAIDLGPAADSWDGGGPMLASTQFCHVGFTTKLPWYLRTGTTLHVLPRWRANDALRVIEAARMTAIGGVAAQIGLLLAVPEFDEHDLAAVETIVVGAGPSPPALVDEARRRFGARYSIRYSSTESGGCGTGTAFDADDEEALHTVGRPRPGVEVRVDPDSGEIELRSAAMMDGYWRDPARTDATFTPDGWLRTSDLGELDDAGRLRVTGRTTDMYIRGGYNVHPLEVERVLLDHPGVRAVAVAPRADPILGERGVAVVVPTGGRDAPAPSTDDLRAFAAPRLAAYKLPDDIVIVDELPLTSMDKLDRGALRAMLEGHG